MSAAAAGAIGSALSSFFSGLFSYFATERTNKQNQQNYEDWKEYNTPANQMERLTDAGLNPYMVNGVSNTLSAPFSVQNNQGISSGLSQLSQALSQGVSGINTAEANEIKRSQYNLNLEALKLRERMVKVAEKKGDAMTALLWSQGTIADLNAKFWQDMADVRRNKYISDATIAAANADFLTDFNPLRLGYYRQFYPLAIEGQIAKNANIRANTSQLFWSRHFMQNKFEKELELAWAKQSLATRLGILNAFNSQDAALYNYVLGSGRLGLQRDYYSLANAKWLTGLGSDLLNFGLKF